MIIYCIIFAQVVDFFAINWNRIAELLQTLTLKKSFFAFWNLVKCGRKSKKVRKTINYNVELYDLKSLELYNLISSAVYKKNIHGRRRLNDFEDARFWFCPNPIKFAKI